MKILIVFTFVLFCSNLYGNKGPVTNLELPRFVSLKSNDVNLRVGPSINYPIELKYIQKNLPIEIIDEFDVWRKVKDHQNNIGWVHKSLIQGQRFVLTLNKDPIKKNIYSRPNGKLIGIVESNNILNLQNCLMNWCLITNKDLKGWISKKLVWGVYENEVYNIRFYQPVINKYWKILDSNFAKKILEIN